MTLGPLGYGRVFWAALDMSWGSCGLLVPAGDFVGGVFGLFYPYQGMLIDVRERGREGQTEGEKRETH